MSISHIKEFITEKDFRQKNLMMDINSLKKQIDIDEYYIEELENSAEILKNAAKVTQEQVQYKIAEAGTLALQSIFDNDIEISVEFGIKSNKTQCFISFIKNGEKYSPSDESGQGAADIAGFGLRVALWSLPAKRSRPVLILDEKFKHLKGEKANISAIKAVKKLSEELNLQIIMISDERVGFEEISSGADRVIKVISVDGQPQTEILK